MARRHEKTRRVGACVCVLGGRCAGIQQRLYGSLDVCGGGGSRAFGRPARPSTRGGGEGGVRIEGDKVWKGAYFREALEREARRCLWVECAKGDPQRFL